METITENRRTATLTDIKIKPDQVFKLQIVGKHELGYPFIVNEFVSAGQEDYNRILRFAIELKILYHGRIYLYLKKPNM